MQLYITLENNYIKDFSFDILEEGTLIEIDAEVFEDFDINYKAYQYIDDQLIKDTDREVELASEFIKNEIRERRDIECFPYINRGMLWYNLLTPKEQEELDEWYQAWLNAPDTLIIPEPLDWLE